MYFWSHDLQPIEFLRGHMTKPATYHLINALVVFVDVVDRPSTNDVSPLEVT